MPRVARVVHHDCVAIVASRLLRGGVGDAKTGTCSWGSAWDQFEPALFVPIPIFDALHRRRAVTDAAFGVGPVAPHTFEGQAKCRGLNLRERVDACYSAAVP
jgi:hypothetical protein